MKKIVILLMSLVILATGCTTKEVLIEDRLPASTDSAADIKGFGKHFIKITESRNKSSVRFQLCLIAEPNECVKIGKKLYYSKDDLSSLKLKELVDNGMQSAVGSVVAITGAATLVLSILAAPESGGASLMAIGGSTVMVATGGTIAAVGIKNFVKTTQLLSDDVINDQPVVLKENILDVAKGLKELLSQID